MPKFTIDRKPFGKQRPRFGKWGTYTPPETTAMENYIKMCYNNQIGIMFSGEVKLTLNFYYPIPKSVTKKVLKLITDGKKRPTVKPDIDNVEKIVLDSLNKVAFPDDAAVVSITSDKWYAIDSEPRIEVEIEEITYEE